MADPGRRRMTAEEFLELEPVLPPPDPELVDLKNAGATWTVHATHARGQKARVPPFEEIELDLDDLFLPPPKNL